MTNELITINDFIDTRATVHPHTYIDQIKKMIQEKWTISTDLINASCITISSKDYQVLEDAFFKEAGIENDSVRPSMIYHGLVIKNADNINSGECVIGYK